MGIRVNIEMTGSTLTIDASDGEVIKMGDSLTKTLGRLVGDAYARRQSHLLCESEGHPLFVDYQTTPEGKQVSVCARCHLAVEEAAT